MEEWEEEMWSVLIFILIFYVSAVTQQDSENTFMLKI